MHTIRKKIYYIILIFIFIISVVISETYAITNINSDPNRHFAWNDMIGWIDFRGIGNVNVSQDGITGSAQFGSVGNTRVLSLDCNTSPSGNICGTSNYRVTIDVDGNLLGWGWSDVFGWISFNCLNHGCGASNYRVWIDGFGNFRGFAWNDIIGWISFSCHNTGGDCGVSNYQVSTTWTPAPARGWLESATFDTQYLQGVAFNSMVWRGSLNGGRVGLQLATSNCANGATNAPVCDANIGWGGSKTTGDGAFIGPAGTSLDTDLYIPSGPNIAIAVRNQLLHNNRQFYRYRVFIETDPTRTATPVIEDITVNWSR